MRIAVLCAGSYVGGTEVVALAMARGLRDRGHDVRVLATAWNNGDFPRRLVAAGIPHRSVYLGKISLSLRSPYPRWTAAALARLPGALLSTRRWLREFAPEVVLANNRDTVLLLDPLLRGLPVLFLMHEAPPRSRASRIVFSRVAARTTKFLAVSEHVRSRLTALGIDERRSRVVYNGVDISGAAPVRTRDVGAPFTVGLIGRIAEWKGHDDLLAALAILRARGVAFRCVIAGTGEPAYVARLRSSAELAQISDRVRWLGYMPDVRALYSELDVCVVPSRIEEAFGMVAAEAALAGVPVVATRRGGLPEVVDDGVTGFLVDPESPSQLAARLAQLAVDSGLRARLGAAGRARVLARFTADRMVSDIEAQCLAAIGCSGPANQLHAAV